MSIFLESKRQSLLQIPLLCHDSDRRSSLHEVMWFVVPAAEQQLWWAAGSVEEQPGQQRAQELGATTDTGTAVLQQDTLWQLTEQWFGCSWKLENKIVTCSFHSLGFWSEWDWLPWGFKNLGYLLWLFKVCPLLAHEENYCLASLQQIGQESGNVVEVVCIVPRVVSLSKINSSRPEKKTHKGITKTGSFLWAALSTLQDTHRTSLGYLHCLPTSSGNSPQRQEHRLGSKNIDIS